MARARGGTRPRTRNRKTKDRRRRTEDEGRKAEPGEREVGRAVQGEGQFAGRMANVTRNSVDPELVTRKWRRAGGQAARFSSADVSIGLGARRRNDWQVRRPATQPIQRSALRYAPRAIPNS